MVENGMGFMLIDECVDLSWVFLVVLDVEDFIFFFYILEVILLGIDWFLVLIDDF